jgi:hypothetical protein
LDLNFLGGEAIGFWDVPCSERDSNEATLTTDCLFRLRLGAVGRDMRRNGRCVSGETGDDTETLSESVEGKRNWAEDDIAWMCEITLLVQFAPRGGWLYACVRVHPPPKRLAAPSKTGFFPFSAPVRYDNGRAIFGISRELYSLYPFQATDATTVSLLSSVTFNRPSICHPTSNGFSCV